jgi:hypothetical protein
MMDNNNLFQKGTETIFKGIDSHQNVTSERSPYHHMMVKSKRFTDFIKTQYGMETAKGYFMSVIQIIAEALVNREWWQMWGLFWSLLYLPFSMGVIVVGAINVDNGDEDQHFTRDNLLICGGTIGTMTCALNVISYIHYQVRKRNNRPGYHQRTTKFLTQLNKIMYSLFGCCLLTVAGISWSIIVDNDNLKYVDYVGFVYGNLFIGAILFYILFWTCFVGIIGAIIMSSIICFIDSTCLRYCNSSKTTDLESSPTTDVDHVYVVNNLHSTDEDKETDVHVTEINFAPLPKPFVEDLDDDDDNIVNDTIVDTTTATHNQKTSTSSLPLDINQSLKRSNSCRSAPEQFDLSNMTNVKLTDINSTLPSLPEPSTDSTNEDDLIVSTNVNNEDDPVITQTSTISSATDDIPLVPLETITYDVATENEPAITETVLNVDERDQTPPLTIPDKVYKLEETELETTSDV